MKNKVFNVDKTVVTKHIKNIYSELELNENSTSANYALVQKEENGKIFQDATYDLIPAVKPQIAMYEQFGIPGLVAFDKTVKYAKEKEKK